MEQHSCGAWGPCPAARRHLWVGVQAWAGPRPGHQLCNRGAGWRGRAPGTGGRRPLHGLCSRRQLVHQGVSCCSTARAYDRQQQPCLAPPFPHHRTCGRCCSPSAPCSAPLAQQPRHSPTLRCSQPRWCQRWRGRALRRRRLLPPPPPAREDQSGAARERGAAPQCHGERRSRAGTPDAAAGLRPLPGPAHLAGAAQALHHALPVGRGAEAVDLDGDLEHVVCCRGEGGGAARAG